MGLLITVEGGEYTGKTSVVIPGLANFFHSKNIPLLVSREPGGTPEGEKMRKHIFAKADSGANPEEMAELFNSARKLHLDMEIKPFLGDHKERNAVVILDRYLDSTRIYQGLEGGMTLEKIKKLESEYVGDYLPDITLICYIPEDQFRTIMKERMAEIRTQTSWDRDSMAQHLKRQQQYLSLPEIASKWRENRQFAPINTAQKKEKVVSDALRACMPLIRSHLTL